MVAGIPRPFQPKRPGLVLPTKNGHVPSASATPPSPRPTNVLWFITGRESASNLACPAVNSRYDPLLVSPQLKLIIAAGFVILVALAGLRAWLEHRQRATGYFAAMARVEIGFIALMLLSLVGLGCVQILLRNAFHSGLIWADPLMRHLVLWLGAFGAALASARMRHISVDALSRLLPERFHPLRRFIVYGITAIAGYLLVVATVRLVLDERQYPEVAFLGIQTWMLEAVLPIAFAIITYRTLVGLFLGRESAETQIETESEA